MTNSNVRGIVDFWLVILKRFDKEAFSLCLACLKCSGKLDEDGYCTSVVGKDRDYLLDCTRDAYLIRFQSPIFL